MARPRSTENSHHARVLVQLRDLILKGEFAAGERLAEIPLAAKLSVSRTPVRLALATLEQEGLVAPLTTGGFVMRRFAPGEIQDAIDVRGHLEGMAARLIAERGLPSSLRAGFQACVQTGDALFAVESKDFDTVAYTEMNNRFHQLLVDGCRNTALARAIDLNNRLPFASASAMLPMQSSIEEGYRWMTVAHMQHRSLVVAMERGQGARAEAIAQEHVNVAKLNLEFALERPDTAARLIPAMRLVFPERADTPAAAGGT
jgi:GntR family transcriptional regulator, vanillate catabolism transcriptional regulator